MSVMAMVRQVDAIRSAGEAVTKENIRFVQIKTDEQLDVQAMPRRHAPSRQVYYPVELLCNVSLTVMNDKSFLRGH